jgi:SAM-dependent methyltransferase
MAQTGCEVTESSPYKEEVRRYYVDKVESMAPANPFFDVKLQILKESCRPWYEVLDAGCGNGNFGLEIAQEVKTLFGCDLTIEMLEYFSRRARERGMMNLNLATGDLTSLPFKSSRFDLIYSYSTLYYIREMEEVLSEFHRVVKPGGMVILELATKYNIQAWHSRLRFDCPQFYLGPWAIDNLVQSAGFTIIQKRYFHLVPPFLHKGIGYPLFIRIRGKTLDEWISSIPFIRSLSFKVLIFGKRQESSHPC